MKYLHDTNESDYPLTLKHSRVGIDQLADVPNVPIHKTSAPKQHDSFNDVYKLYYDELVTGLLAKYGEGPPDPQDIAQEAFHRVYQMPDVSKIKSIKAFVWRTARNLLINDLRTQTLRSKYELEVERIFFSLKGDNLSPENVIEARRQLKRVDALILSMPEKRRTALIMNRVDGKSLLEIAKLLQISRKSVAKHIAKAQAEIHEHFFKE